MEKSINNPYSKDSYQKGISYEKLAEIYFSEGILNSGAYLDSLLQVSGSDKSYRIKKAKKKERLDDVLKFEQVIYETDSLFKLIEMIHFLVFLILNLTLKT